MSKLKRYFRPGQVYFVTLVTHDRIPVLVDYADVTRASLKNKLTGGRLIAWVIMPDHMHLVLDPRSENFADLIHRFKLSVGANYRKRMGAVRDRLWQSRYWDHIIRDEEDLNRHIDYIHYNPVKHGFAKDPFVWLN